jgi:hypothetical protein
MGTALRFAGGGAEKNKRLGETDFFSGSWNPAASRARILVGLRFVPSFTGQTSGIGGISWCAECLATHLRLVHFTHRSMLSEQEKNSILLDIFLRILVQTLV